MAFTGTLKDESILRGKIPCVEVAGKKSGWHESLRGIPQRSVIVQILFVVFINDIPEEAKFNVYNFLLRTCKLNRVADRSEANTMQQDLDNLQEWSNRWQLPFNAKKYIAMYFGAYDEQVHTGGNIPTKDLGVMIDRSLTFHIHTSCATMKANQILGVVKQTTQFVM